MSKPKVHMVVSVSVGDSGIPACGAYGWLVTSHWPKVTCKRCLNHRETIDNKNQARIRWFNSVIKEKE